MNDDDVNKPAIQIVKQYCREDQVRWFAEDITEKLYAIPNFRDRWQAFMHITMQGRPKKLYHGYWRERVINYFIDSYVDFRDDPKHPLVPEQAVAVALMETLYAVADGRVSNYSEQEKAVHRVFDKSRHKRF